MTPGDRIAYDFAVLRAVPHVHLGAFVPVGVLVHARTTGYLGMRVLSRETLTSAGRGRMFAREIPCKWIIELFASITIVGFVVYFWLLWDNARQELWDKMVETIVVNDPENVLDPRR